MVTKAIKAINRFVFECSYKSSSVGFLHLCKMTVNDDRVFSTSIHYADLCFEPYTYAEVMLKALFLYKLTIKKELKKKFLESNGYKRMTPKREAAFYQLLDEDEQIKECSAVHTELSDGIWKSRMVKNIKTGFQKIC